MRTGEHGVPTSGEQDKTAEGDKAEADKRYIQAHILDLEQRLMQVRLPIFPIDALITQHTIPVDKHLLVEACAHVSMHPEGYI